MTKSKSSTIAIVVLSVLLAAALASTIVLAAFQASREASVTLNFGAGVSLQVNGVGGNEGSYYWISNVGGEGQTSGTVPSIAADDDVNLSAISAVVTGQDAYIAVYANITKTAGDGEAPASITPVWNSSVIPVSSVTDMSGVTNKTGWYVIGSTDTATATTGGQTANLIDKTDIFTVASDDANEYAGAIYNCEVKVAAAASVAELVTLINSLNA